MPTTPTLTPISRSDSAADQRQLFELGMGAIRRLSQHTWTDHNTHDPGITQLELFAYALTDLAYRARFPMQDLLASPEEAEAVSPAFDSAASILPNAPVTLADYRKLLIDLPGVKNAWLRPAPVTLYADPTLGQLWRKPQGTPAEQAVMVSGRYQAMVDYMDHIRTSSDRQAVQDEIISTLHAHRSLCMDFAPVVVEVRPCYFSLCAEIDLQPEADVAQAAADISFAVDRFLAPPVLNYTLVEMLSRQHADGSPWTIPEIFEGPALQHGFIPDEALEAGELRTEVRLSDIINIIMDIPGVLAVRDILMNPLDAGGKPHPPTDKWRMSVPDGHQPRLSVQAGRLAFYKKNLPLNQSQEQVAQLLQEMRETERRKLEEGVAGEWTVPLGRYRNPATYHSIQTEFPAIYGLSEAGLSSAAPAPRRAQALQLKGWLTLFDHVMAGYASQLAHIRDLFSLQPTQATSYFAQQINSYPDWEKIYSAGFAAADLADIVEPGDLGLARRNRFLDHLLARYAEDFSGYAAVIQSSLGLDAAQMLKTKCDFLSSYAETGGKRGHGYDTSLTTPEDLWNTQSNISGYEQRVCRLLGIVNPARRNLSAVAHELYDEIDKVEDGIEEYRFRLRHPVSGKILLSSSTHYPTQAAARAEMSLAIARAQLPESYQRKRTGDNSQPDSERRWYFNIVDAGGEIIARRIEYFASAPAMEFAIAELIQHLREHYSGEGMYMIEHLLLLTDGKDDPLLDICTDSGCADCAEPDPYSHRLTIVLPAYAGRFIDMHFRRFVESTLRAEAPAHVLPRICWLNPQDMAEMETAYRNWLSWRAGLPGSSPDSLARLIDILTRAKNVYPVSHLHACGQTESPPFIVGASTLGSSDSNALPDNLG